MRYVDASSADVAIYLSPAHLPARMDNLYYP